MLVLSRRLHEKIVFPSVHATVEVVSVKGNTVRLGIDAPPDFTVLREEVQDRLAQWKPPPAAVDGEDAETRLRELGHVVRKRLEVARKGLEVMQRHLEAGRSQEAQATLETLREDLGLLWSRLDGQVAEPVPQAAGSPRGCKALLVEDNVNERQLLATYLRTAGLDVATAGDGSDALDYLRTSRPDVILLDMGLPRCDGATMVRTIRRDPTLAGLKIIAVTGHSPEEFDLANGPEGVDRWFHKPVDPADLVRGVNQELTAWGLQRSPLRPE